MTFAQRVAGLKPEGAYAVLAKAQALEKEGRHIIHLEIGEPDFYAADHVRDAGIEAIEAGKTRYNPPSGINELRQAIAEDAGRRRGMQIEPAQVVVGPGAKPALFFPTLALAGPGDEVIFPDPGFPTYQAMIEVAGAKPVPVPLLEENSFSFDLTAFDNLVNEHTRLVILNSPSNPTGGVMPQEDLQHIADAAQKHDFWVMSDEIYMRLVYDSLQAPSIAALPGMQERTIIVDGFSKTYAMTGWRLGYGIMPQALAEKVGLLLTHSIGCTAQFTQVAGVEAVIGQQGWVDEMVAAYQQRRDALVAGLNAIPRMSCQKPQGAFYVFPNITAFGMSSMEIADLLLEEAGVALLPGTSFGEYGEGYLRLSYANSLENIQQAVTRMSEALTKI